MITIENRIFKFFIEILSYCALNKQKGISVYSDLSDKRLLEEVKDWIQNIININSFAENSNQPKLIYYLFPDTQAVGKLDKIFPTRSFKKFIKYYDFCKEKIDKSYDENNIELFAHINLFHLIGSFRYYYLLNTENYSEILRRLNDILSVTTCHPLIKYSALQISTLVSIKSDEIEIKEAYKHIPSFRDEYLKQLEYMENRETSLLVKYVSFYSMYYYENKYQSKALINEKYLDRMINKETNSIDFKYLHTLIPQLASQLIRLDVEIYNKNEIGERLRLLFDFEKTNRDNIKEIKKLQKDINGWYAKCFDK